MSANSSYIVIVLSTEQISVLGYIDISTAVLSLFGAGSVVITSLARGIFTQPEIHPIFHLSLADLFASTCLIISAVLFTTKHPEPICTAISMLAYAFYVITFFLTIGYALQCYMVIRTHQRTTDSFPSLAGVLSIEEDSKSPRQTQCYCSNATKIILIYVISWFLPLLSCFILLLRSIMDKSIYDTKRDACSSCLPLFHFREDQCWALQEEDSRTLRMFLRMGFLIPLVGVIIGNSILYILLYRKYRKKHRSQGIVNSEHHQRMRVIRNRALVFQSVFLLCWLPSLILGFVSFSPDFSMSTVYPLYILQAMTAPLQGFLNSVVYAWHRKVFVLEAHQQAQAMNGNDYQTFDTTT